MNQKGIVLSGLVYALLVFFMLLLASLLMILWYRQSALNNLKDDANDIYDGIYIPEILLTSKFTLDPGTDATYLLKNGSNYFSGANPNNWLQFGQVSSSDATPLLWRIIKNDADGIKIIYEGAKNGTNPPTANGSINTSIWDTIANKWERTDGSSIKDAIATWYSNTFYAIRKTNYVQSINWCIGAIDSSSTVTEFKNYECIDQTTVGGSFLGRTTATSSIGLINPSDYLSTTTSEDCYESNQTICGNNNFLYKASYSYWTENVYSQDADNVWYISSTGSVLTSTHDNATTRGIRPVINLKFNTLWVSGNGTLTTPYIIEK